MDRFPSEKLIAACSLYIDAIFVFINCYIYVVQQYVSKNTLDINDILQNDILWNYMNKYVV